VTAHQLAKLLLDGPDHPVYRSTSGGPGLVTVEEVKDVLEAYVRPYASDMVVADDEDVDDDGLMAAPAILLGMS